MSTAVFSIDDQQKLPSLAQIIPGQQQPSQQQMYSPQPPHQPYPYQGNPEYYYQMPQQPGGYSAPVMAPVQPPPPQPQMLVAEKCTCKLNANRIPRPRNAFILFRQKHHQLVLDESLVIRTNPEVSRELGRRWKELPPDEKEMWNQLAEEEKKNHAKKYPGYRYTPRRNGKLKNCHVCRRSAMRALVSSVLSPMVMDYVSYQQPMPPQMLADQFTNPFPSYNQYVGYDQMHSQIPQVPAPQVGQMAQVAHQGQTHPLALPMYDKLSPLLLGPVMPAAGSVGDYLIPPEQPVAAPVRFNLLPLTNFFGEY